MAPTAGACVVAVDLRDDPARGDAAWRDARLAEAAETVSVHAAAYRRDALVAQACGQIYAMLPQPPADDRADTERALLRWAGDVVSVLRGHTRTPVQAVVAGTAARLGDIPAVKLRGHHGLEILARTPDRAVETHGALTSSLLDREAVALAGLDLDDPEHRLAAMPGLRLLDHARPRADGAPYFP
ncbi:hypothetical protein SUDANB105_01683 [Streptomyces sp. enrichment culture]|uniref:hypothetical protein n=1 Tax=Streptomyces sp. enrichment culture TaxID=1795815 RepID=UPI003F55820A